MPPRTGFLDLASGVSGDMLLGACADAGRAIGVPVEEAVARAVDALGLGASVSFEEATRGGLRCLRAVVRTDDSRHDPTELRSAIGRADASADAKEAALAGLTALVDAEARAHGTEPADVHLHELGSADTAADLLGAAVALEALEVGTLTAAPVPVPGGWTTTDHGELPLPAPVTAELLRGVAVRGQDADREIVTPTGVAVLRGIGCTFGPMPAMTLEGVGVGGGSMDPERPNVCRLFVGVPTPTPDRAALPEGLDLVGDVLLETNIDDQSPEGIGWTLERLMASGAKDAWVTSIVMKKSRPAFQLSVLCDPSDEGRILDVLLRETTTLGVRRRDLVKWTLQREEMRVEVRGTTIRVKVARYGAEIVRVAPEYDDCARVAERDGVPFQAVFADAHHRALRALDG